MRSRERRLEPLLRRHVGGRGRSTEPKTIEEGFARGQGEVLWRPTGPAIGAAHPLEIVDELRMEEGMRRHQSVACDPNEEHATGLPRRAGREADREIGPREWTHALG